MTTRPTAKTLALDTLYELIPTGNGVDVPSMEIIGGTADIYGSNKLPASSPVTDDMFKSGDGFVGIDKLETVPRYLYVTENTATVATVLLMGVTATAV